MRFRFSTCCESIVQYCDAKGDSPIIEIATKVFDKVMHLLIEAERKSEILRKAQISDLMDPAPKNISLARKARNCWDNMQTTHEAEIKKIQGQLKMQNKLRWAVYEKEAFDGLVESVTVLIGELERAFLAGIDILQRRMAKLAIEEVPKEKSWKR